MTGDLVAFWDVPLSDGVHRIEFEHGTTSGKRIIRVDGKELVHRDWMFKLVGDEVFNVGKARCVIKVEPVGGFSYSYSLEKDTLDVWANGKKLDAMGEFVEDGTETHFSLGDTPAYIKAVTSGKRREGIIHSLIVNNTVIPEVQDR
ncbi:Fas apoptotic inhibitory molecule 1 [Blattella germanica]|nr:Fas apoptotic inhibitory molecule 1 [Blattella germanica]